MGYGVYIARISSHITAYGYYGCFASPWTNCGFFSHYLAIATDGNKERESLQQMVSLGAYIRVFYDEASQVNFSAESAKFYWETVDKKMNSILNSDANNSNSVDYYICRTISKSSWFNSEYTGLSIVSDAFFLLAGFDLSFSVYSLFHSTRACVIACVFLIVLEVLAIYGIREISRVSSGKHNMLEIYSTYRNKYFELAVKYGIFDFEKAKQVWKDLTQDETPILGNELRRQLDNLYNESNQRQHRK